MPASTTVNLSLREVLSGRILIVKEALQHFGMLESIRQITFDVLADTLPIHVIQEVKNRGLEQLHNLVTPPQASTARSSLETRLRSVGTSIALIFSEMISRQSSPIYLCKHFGVRIMLPEDTIAAHKIAFKDQAGFMIPHGVHRDSWFNTGINSVNLWIAISRVRRGNGLLIFPDAYGRDVPQQDGYLDPNTSVGEPINFEMQPGDILVFAGDHLHSSEPNVTNETRYVLTKRISLGAPQYNPQGNSWVPYYDTRLLGTALEPLAALRSRVSLSYARAVLRTTRCFLASTSCQEMICASKLS